MSAEIVSRSAARITKEGVHTDRDESMLDPQTHSSWRTSALGKALRAGKIPCKRSLLRQRNGWRVRRQLQFGAALAPLDSSTPCCRGVGMMAARKWLCGAKQPP